MNIVVGVLIYLLIFGLVALLIRKAPFIEDDYKQIALYVLLVVFVLFVIDLLTGFMWGGPDFKFRGRI